MSKRGLSQLRSRLPAGPYPPGQRPSGSGPAQQSLLEQQAWLEWMRPQLPPELAAHLVRVLPRAHGPLERELIVFADSPAWCARLRYALLGLQERIHARDPAIRRTVTRVLMLAEPSIPPPRLTPT